MAHPALSIPESILKWVAHPAFRWRGGVLVTPCAIAPNAHSCRPPFRTEHLARDRRHRRRHWAHRRMCMTTLRRPQQSFLSMRFEGVFLLRLGRWFAVCPRRVARPAPSIHESTLKWVAHPAFRWRGGGFVTPCAIGPKAHSYRAPFRTEHPSVTGVTDADTRHIRECARQLNSDALKQQSSSFESVEGVFLLRWGRRPTLLSLVANC